MRYSEPLTIRLGHNVDATKPELANREAGWDYEIRYYSRNVTYVPFSTTLATGDGKWKVTTCPLCGDTLQFRLWQQTFAIINNLDEKNRFPMIVLILCYANNMIRGWALAALPMLIATPLISAIVIGIYTNGQGNVTGREATTTGVFVFLTISFLLFLLYLWRGIDRSIPVPSLVALKFPLNITVFRNLLAHHGIDTVKLLTQVAAGPWTKHVLVDKAGSFDRLEDSAIKSSYGLCASYQLMRT
jgi:hypothetical protein